MLTRIFFLVLLVSGALWAQPEGRFLVGEAEGDDFKWALVLEGESARLESAEGHGPGQELKMIPIGDRLFHLVGGEKSDPVRGYLRMRSEHEGLLFFSGRDRLFLVYKTSDEELAPLQGDWKGLAGRDEIEVKVEGKTITFGADQTVPTRLVPVVPQNGDLRVVSFPENRDSFLLYFTPLQEDLWLVRNHEEDDFLIMYRGETPGWVKAELELRRRGTSSKESTSSKSSE